MSPLTMSNSHSSVRSREKINKSAYEAGGRACVKPSRNGIWLRKGMGLH